MTTACALCGERDNICEGLGVIRYDVPLDDERFGKLFRCPNFPVERDQARHARLRQMSHLAALSDKRFDNFYADNPMHTPAERESLIFAYNTALAFAESPDFWLLLEGGYGTGKTHLAAAVGNARVEHGDVVLFITSPDLLDHLRGSYDSQGESYDETFERIKTCDLLILDDLGAENPSAWAREKLFQLLNYRYIYARPTVITTNNPLEQLDPRIRSRLLDETRTHRCRLTAPDFRTISTGQRDLLDSDLGSHNDQTFETFDAMTGLNSEERARLGKTMASAKAYASTPEKPWLVLAGHTGTGKTHLAAAIALERQARQDDVFFITVSDLMDDLRAGFSPVAGGSTFDQRFNRVRNVGLLVLDDLGSGGMTEWTREKLFQLIDYRYVKRLPTVFTISDSDRVGERIMLRIVDPRLSDSLEINVPPYVRRIRGGQS
jgi:DNA replication protein DnaC